MKSSSKTNISIIALIIGLIVISVFYFFRIDLTSDKRFSISKQTKELMKTVDAPMNIKVYLTGDLNPGFLHLKKATVEMLNELNIYDKKPINIRYENPSEAESNEQREANYQKMEMRGMTATSVYEKDKEGKDMQKIIYPWLEITYNGKTIPVSLLKNLQGLSGAENLNISIENLEFELTDAIRQLTTTHVSKIAFLEGQGELSEIETYDISKALSKYFQIDRGVIGTDASILNDYKALIIAKPMTAFSEKDKFVIDQYIMNGGRVLWLVDGVRVSEESLAASGTSPAMGLDLNLNDILFKYGVRVSSNLLEDVQSALIPMNIAPNGQKPHFELMPWVFSPLLLTSDESPITRNVPPVKASFASSIEMVGDLKNVKRQFLIATSNNTHILETPAEIDLANLPDLKDEKYYNTAYVPVGAVLEGEFPSDFADRMPPQDIVNPPAIKRTSVPTRQIFISCGDVIKNDVEHQNDTIQALPLGFDRFMNQQFGNREFITNAILYLTDQDGWMNLRNRTIQLRLLNKKVVSDERTKWQIINVVAPIILLLIIGLLYQFLRKRKYAK